MRGFEAGCEETREAARKWGNHGGRDRAASLSIGDDMSNLNFHFYFHYLSFLSPSHVWIHSEGYLPGMRIGGGLSKWGPALLSTLILSSKTLQSIWNSKGLQQTLTMFSSTSVLTMMLRTSMLTRMLSTLVFFSMLLPASNSLKCFSCYSKDSCYTENILIKVGWIVLKPLHCKKGLEQADKPAGTDEWYCKRGSRLLLALYTPPTLALSLEAASDDM